MAATARTVRIALTIALGGLLVGFDAAVISGAVPLIRGHFGLSGASGSFKLGLAVSALGWGAMAGNLCAGSLVDRMGRRSALRLTAWLFLGSSIGTAVAPTFSAFVVARVVGGLAVGIAILTGPIFIAEIAPARRRGMLVTLNQLMIVSGISASYCSNALLLASGDDDWRWMFGVEALPALLFLALLFTVPESPRWLLARGRGREGLAILRWMHGGEAEVTAEDGVRAAREDTAGRWRHLLNGRHRGAFYFALGIAFFQQATGINAVLYYLPTILTQTSGGLGGAMQQSVVVGVVNLVMTLVAMWVVDRVGRRPLLLVGVGGMAVALLTASWALRALPIHPGVAGAHPGVVVAALAVFVASFAVSLGPVMWVMIAEIFPNADRALAVSIVGFWNSLVSALVTLVFPWELARFGVGGALLVFALVSAVALAFIARFAPETSGKTLERLEESLHGGASLQRAPPSGGGPLDEDVLAATGPRPLP